MFKVRTDILQKLKCSLCEGYLNISPIMVKSDKSQICGKCFKILPLEEKMKCVRQVGYETLAEMLLFPCRYNLQGCQSEFPLNEADNHELECPFRFTALGSNGESLEVEYEDPMLYRNIPYVSDGNVLVQEKENYVAYTTSPTISFTTSDASGCVSIRSNYTVKENKVTQTPTTIKYETNIYSNDNRKFLYPQGPAKTHNNYVNYYRNNNSSVLSIEGAISLSTFQNIYCKVTLNSLQEPEYDTIPDNSASNYPKCAKCSGVVKKEIYHCSFGHDVSKNCKGNTCALCTSPINSVPRYYCENFSKGCHVYLLYTEQYLHKKDCEFGEFKCLLQQQCNEELETLSALKEHLKEKHLTSITLSNLIVKQASNKDEFWIMLAFDNIFKCKRFYYESEVEFLVEFVGPHKIANNFKYEIYIKSDDKNIKLTKHAACVGWDSSALDQALIITKKELKAVNVDKLNFTYTLNLIKVLKE